MRALCWEELRENWRWAVLTAVGLGGAQRYTLSRGGGVVLARQSWSNDGLPLNSTAF